MYKDEDLANSDEEEDEEVQFDSQNFLQSKDKIERIEEVEEIKEYMEQQGVEHELQRWDWAYYSEKLRKEKYNES